AQRKGATCGHSFASTSARPACGLGAPVAPSRPGIAIPRDVHTEGGRATRPLAVAALEPTLRRRPYGRLRTARYPSPQGTCTLNSLPVSRRTPKPFTNQYDPTTSAARQVDLKNRTSSP